MALCHDFGLELQVVQHSQGLVCHLQLVTVLTSIKILLLIPQGNADQLDKR